MIQKRIIIEKEKGENNNIKKGKLKKKCTKRVNEMGIMNNVPVECNEMQQKNYENNVCTNEDILKETNSADQGTGIFLQSTSPEESEEHQSRFQLDTKSILPVIKRPSKINIVEHIANKLFGSDQDLKECSDSIKSEFDEDINSSQMSNTVLDSSKHKVGGEVNVLNSEDDMNKFSNTKLENESRINEDKIENTVKILEPDHVSLSEALAKLVDSEDSSCGSEADTVTIHPVINYESLEKRLEGKKSESIAKNNLEHSPSFVDQLSSMEVDDSRDSTLLKGMVIR